MSYINNMILADDIPPVIDISRLFDSDENNILFIETSNKIDLALRTYGIFIATGHNMLEEMILDSFDSSYQLFNSSFDEKKEVSMNNTKYFGRGYISFGEESGLNEYFEPKEGFSYG